MSLSRLFRVFLSALMLGTSIQPVTAEDTEHRNTEITGEAVYTDRTVPVYDTNDTDSFELPVRVLFRQTNARSELEMLNEFRTGDDAWYWDSDNSTKIYPENLGEISYDYALEQVAMQRAVEVAVYYAHTRPDGNSCWQTYDDLGYSWWRVGENIAAGYTSAASVFNAWREDNDNYSGQGHRRNMLNPNFKAFGAACVYYEGYYYWVQEFTGDVVSAAETPANDDYTIRSALVKNSYADTWTLTEDTLNIDNTQPYDILDLMQIKYTLTIAGWSPQARVRTSMLVPDWVPEDKTIVKFEDGYIYGLKAGTTKMNAVSPDGATDFTVTVNITAVHTWGEPVYTWSDDLKTVTASVSCTDCDETVTETVNTVSEITVQPGCETEGTEVYTAAFTNELFSTQTKEISIPAAGHDYSFSSWRWADDYKSASAVFVCSRDSSHTVTKDAEITETVTDPTCSAEGQILYTASVTFEGNTYTDTKTTVIGKIPHVYGTPSYVWAEDNSTVTASAVCTVCGEELEETVNTTLEVIKEPTIEEEGWGKYTAEFENPVFETQSREGAIPKLPDHTPKSISINRHETNILYGRTEKLTATVLPGDAEDKSVTWTSSDTEIVTVDQNGNIKGVRPGTAAVTASTVNGLTDTCEVRVLFTDVADSTRYFYGAVYWAVDNNITVGAGGPGLFSPNANCTREQIVTFLWRLSGEPEPKTESSFTDVPKDKWYYAPITWAYEKGITTGLNDGTGRFGVGQPCTREQCVTFLYRAADKPAIGEHKEFADVTADRYYYDAISWAASEGITVGLNDGTNRFGVGQKCSRAMIVSFLYRYKNTQ